MEDLDDFAAPPHQSVEADYPMPVIKLHAPPYSEAEAAARRNKLLTK